jgi:hypothetical protein
MNRRDAIARVGLLFGGTVLGAEAFLSGCAKRGEETASLLGFSEGTIAVLDEVGETILPDTPASPGAKAAGIGTFMKAIVTDCYEEKDQQIFVAGISALNEASREKFGNEFIKISPEERHTLLVSIDKEAKDYNDNKKKDDPTHYFTMMKQLTLWGYFTSEIGSTKALRYLPLPGKYEGCIDYKKGDRAWSAI